MKPIRILHVFGRLDRGGAETMVMNFYRNIDRSKVQFDFVIHTDEECDFNKEIHELGGKIFSIPRYNGRNHFAYKRAWIKLFKKHPEYNIIHGHIRSTATIYTRIAKGFGITTIVHSHSTASRGNKFEQLVKNVMQLPIRYIADYMLACSLDAGKWLFGKNVQKKHNFRVIKNAIKLDKFIFNEGVRNQIRDKYNIGNKLVLGHVGNFTSPKNHSFLLDVFFEVNKRRKDVVLLLVGDGELKNKINNKAMKLGIKDKVIMVGSTNNVNNYLQAMDIFLFPSLFEGLGIAAIEAQAAGLPCLISEYVPDEVCVTQLATKIPVKSSKTWAEYVLNTELQRGNYCNDIIKNGYDIDNQVKYLQKFYLELASYSNIK